jgi:hypothetical protein
MGVDQDAAQTLDAEKLDESHPAHVGFEVIDLHRTIHSANGVLFFTQVERETFRAFHPLIPIVQRLAIDGANPRESKFAEMARERSANESAGAGDYDLVV